MKPTYILAIESSCDETAAAVVKNGREVLSNIISSQNAQITAMSIYNGQIMRGVGDCVRKGDVIVSGVASDNKGHINLRHSFGTVTAIYEDSINIHQDFHEVISEKTVFIHNKITLPLLARHIH